MDIAVAGLGHVGLVTAACFAHVGHHVIGIDTDRERIEDLKRGKIPFYEPDLQPLVGSAIDRGSLVFESNLGAAVERSVAIFMCVGTPSLETGEADLSQVEHLAVELAQTLDGDYKVLVEKSTVPVLTGQRVYRTIQRLTSGKFDVVSNPEFLREGRAVKDTLEPDRIVVGSPSERATAVLREVYEPIVSASGCPMIVTDLGTAELIKHASNSFLATKISFINIIAEICEKVGVDVEDVAVGMGLDPRIGPEFLRPGIGYGGSCFPKDVAALAAIGETLLGRFDLLRAVQAINDRAVVRLVDKVRSELWHLRRKRIGVLGLAFKPDTDDLREAPSVKIISMLVEEGAEVRAYDPVALLKAKEVLPSEVTYAPNAIDAVRDAHAALILTDWPEFQELDPHELHDALMFPIIADGRNLFDPEAMRAAGITYLSMGRGVLHP